VEVLLDKIKESSGSVFIRTDGINVSYDDVATRMSDWQHRLEEMGILPGHVVSLVGRFAADSTILLLALLENLNIVVPIDEDSLEDLSNRNRTASVDHCLRCISTEEVTHEALIHDSSHELIQLLRKNGEAGIILFTSGSTGESKAAIHSFPRMLAKYPDSYKKKPFNIAVFLKFDHIGGLNTMLSVLMHGGCMTEVVERSPFGVCELIEREGVEVLPTTPSFLTMLIISQAWQKYDLSTLKTITYGTEPMPDSTLAKLNEVFPGIKLKQTYGLTELGIFPTRSRPDTTRWSENQGCGRYSLGEIRHDDAGLSQRCFAFR